MSKKNIKICFAASSGGHYEQLMMLKPLMRKYESFIVTEKTKYNAKSSDIKTCYMNQVNRKEWKFIPNMIINTFIITLLNLSRKYLSCKLFLSRHQALYYTGLQ